MLGHVAEETAEEEHEEERALETAGEVPTPSPSGGDSVLGRRAKPACSALSHLSQLVRRKGRHTRVGVAFSEGFRKHVSKGQSCGNYDFTS